MRTLMPSAPLRIVLMTARFMARRNITRFSICCEMLSATSCASSSGLRISEMFRRTSLTAMPSSFAVSPRSFSMSSPFLPMTMPGRAVWMVMFTFLAARSIEHAADRGVGELLLQEFAHPEVGVHQQRKLLLAGIPLRRPVTRDPKPYAQRIDLLAHG